MPSESVKYFTKRILRNKHCTTNDLLVKVRLMILHLFYYEISDLVLFLMKSPKKNRLTLIV